MEGFVVDQVSKTYMDEKHQPDVYKRQLLIIGLQIPDALQKLLYPVGGIQF